DIGYCDITGESSIGAGLRRIEAVTGRAAEALVWDQEALLERVARQLETSPGELEARVTSLVQETARLRRETSAQERTASRDQAQDILNSQASARTQEFNGIKVVSGIAQVSSAEALRDIGDWLRDKLGGGAVVLGTVVRERPMLLVMVTGDPVARGLHAGNAVKEAAKVMGGGGGGGPEMAQAGGRDVDKLENAVQAAVDTLAQQAGATK
ncbi:MAG: alanine--tRNA ligase, partial [Chloroflexi bacterium]|nr:alanine--tRNA ligase [Chloroflexota bacterium]